MRMPRLASGALLAVLLVATRARPAYARVEAPLDRHPPPTLFWMLAQAVPSPELGVGGPTAAAGLRWQLTPALYSFGIYRKLSPWRFFVVEPLTRQSGSIELFVSPELVTARTHEWIGRSGVHSTFPILERGEKLAFTIGAGLAFGAETSADFEAGVSVLFGAVGLFVSYAPRVKLAPATFSLRVRFF